MTTLSDSSFRWAFLALMGMLTFSPVGADAGMTPAEVEAFEGFKVKAEQGDASSQFETGYCYARGSGTPRDFTAAANWYRKSAEQGNARAQNALGVFYYGGLGVPKSHSEAVYWYRKAASQNYPQAQSNLGGSYERGEGVPVNLLEAIALYRKSAEQGHAWGLYHLAKCYAEGKGVMADNATAYALFNLATLSKDTKGPEPEESAKLNLAKLEGKMPAEALQRGQRIALQLRKDIEARKAAGKVGN